MTATGDGIAVTVRDGRHSSPRLPHLEEAPAESVQSVLDSDARFSRGIKESLCFPGGNFASISESLEIKSISCKRGGERFFDIIYHTVVLVDKRLTIPRRSGALETTPHPVEGAEDGLCTRFFGVHVT